jgi:CRP-like cAMP-binding protein
MTKNQSVINLPLRENLVTKSNKKAIDRPLFIETGVLTSGKAFGELALIKNKPRAATIICLEDCHFAVMSKSDYEKVL